MTRPDTEVAAERERLVAQLIAVTRGPLNVLAIVWLALVLGDIAGLLTHSLQIVSDVIWAIFGLAFVLELWVAPDRRRYLKENWFGGLTLILPGLRVLRIFRGVRVLASLRVVRSLSLLRVISSLNKGLYSLNRVLRRHQLGYVAAFTMVVVVAAAALLFHFERTAVLGRPVDGTPALDTFSDAMWWAAGAASFAGSDYNVRTSVGRALRLFMSFYSWSGFGYMTATVASHFLAPTPEEGAPDPVAALTDEVQAMRRELRELSARLEGAAPGGGHEGSESPPPPASS
jgi:voltage-gated potassium channel